MVSMRHAVSVASENAAARSQGIPSGILARFPCRHDDVLGRGSGGMLAEQAEAPAERLVAAEAGLTGTAREAGVDHHPVAGGNASHRGSHRLHHPRGIRADDVRQLELEPRQPARDPEIEVIERRHAHPHAHLVRALDGRLGEIAHGEVLDAADGVERERAHQKRALGTCSPWRQPERHGGGRCRACGGRRGTPAGCRARSRR